MIPAIWDDGFTHEGEQGILFRPLLRQQRSQLRDRDDTELKVVVGKLFAPPNYWGPPVEELASSTRMWFARKIMSGAKEEDAAFQEVDQTVTLLVQHPGLMKLSCDDCKAYATDHEKGEVLFDQIGNPMVRKLPPPCDVGKTCPKGHWSNQKRPTTLGLKVWRHYWFMKASGVVFDCPIIARNWAFIDWVVRYGRRAEFNPFHS